MIDCFAHLRPNKYVEGLENSDLASRLTGRANVFKSTKLSQYGDIRSRVADLDEYNIDLQVAAPPVHLQPDELLKDEDRITEIGALTRSLNDSLADESRISKGRVVCNAYVSLPLVECGKGEGLDEMTRAIKELGLVGFEIPTHIHGKPVYQFPAFWEKAAELNVPVFIHPHYPATYSSRPYEAEFFSNHIFGFSFDTSLILSGLVFSGIMDKNPRLKVVAHHLGGTIPLLMGRISETYEVFEDNRNVFPVKLSKAPVEYFRMFYYDTAIGGNGSAIRCGIETLGAEHIVFSADYPNGPDGGVGRLRSYPELIRNLGISSSDQQKILDLNMRKLLRME